MRQEGRCQICGAEQFVRGYCEKHHDLRLTRLRERSLAKGRRKTCSFCNKEGHNIRGCPSKKSHDRVEQASA